MWDVPAYQHTVEPSKDKPVKKRSVSPDTVLPSPAKKMKQEPSCFIDHQCINDQCIRIMAMRGIPLLQAAEVEQMTGPVTGLGAGGFGFCFKTVHPRTGEQLAVKTFFEEKALDSLLNEATNLSQLQVDGVQRLVGVCVQSRQLITRYAGVTSTTYKKTYPSFVHVASVCLQVSRALQRIHQQGHVHCDIKADNICVSQGKGGPVATIIDVGLATSIGSCSVVPVWKGCMEGLPWVAPELIKYNSPCTEASDVYSLAIWMKRVGLLKMPAQCSTRAVKSLISKTLLHDPNERPSLASIIKALKALHKEARATQWLGV